MKFGIMGFGRFGRLWANALLPFGSVVVYDKNNAVNFADDRIKKADLPEVAQADVVFLLIPISEFDAGCLQIKDFLKPDTLVVDCCSVKVHPVTVMQKHFSQTQPLLGTHPLFGPDSVKRSGGLKNHKIVVCPVRCAQDRQEAMEEIFKRMGLTVLTGSPEEHDKEMANSQGLVHFIGRGLAALNLQPQEISTPDFQALLNINNMVVNDSWRLFLDMHQYNAYTKQIRKKFIHQLIKLDEAIADGKS